MSDIIFRTLLGVTALLAIVSCIVTIFLKMFYHFKYIKLMKDGGEGSDLISNIPVIVAPIIIRNIEEERSNKELARIGIKIKKLLIVFFSLLLYSLIISQLM